MSAFNHIASNYDHDFTHSAVGALQRQKVWDYLDKVLPGRPLSILELNCGTGEDAIHFANQGHQVIATDLSTEMIAIAMLKAGTANLDEKISFLRCDIGAIEKVDFKRKFDLIFSNFGGLNCVDAMALKKLSKVTSRLLKTDGRFIGVIMPSFCLWESLYFLGKANGKNIFRRATKGPVKVAIEENIVETWYYKPLRIRKIFKDEFQLHGLKPVGFFLPPSYLQKYFESRKSFLDRLDRLENSVSRFSSLSSCSDHFLIDLKLNPTAQQ